MLVVVFAVWVGWCLCWFGFVGCLWFDSVSLVLCWIAWVGCFAIGCVGMLCCVVNSVVVYVYLHFTLRLACLVWCLCSLVL